MSMFMYMYTDATEERLHAALRQLQELTSGSAASPPDAAGPQHGQATKKSRVDEPGLSRDASPSASAPQTPRATTAPSAKVTFTPVGHQPRSSARRSTSAPPSKQGTDKDEVVSRPLTRRGSPRSGWTLFSRA